MREGLLSETPSKSKVADKLTYLITMGSKMVAVFNRKEVKILGQI